MNPVSIGRLIDYSIPMIAGIYLVVLFAKPELVIKSEEAIQKIKGNKFRKPGVAAGILLVVGNLVRAGVYVAGF